MKLATKRLILRPFTSSDVDNVHSYSKKETVTRFMEWGPNTHAQSENFVYFVLNQDRSLPKKEYNFIVQLKDGTVIGACSIKIREDFNSGELGWIYNDIYWNQGYGTEVCRALMAFAFNTLKLPKIYARADEENIGSYRIMEKVGMRFVMRSTKETKKLGKKDNRIYELTALEFKLNNHKTFI